MRYLPLLATLLVLLAACSAPVPVQERLTVDGGSSAPVTLEPGKSAYFEVAIGADPVRIDAFATVNKETADLDLIVYNEDRVPIAVADSRLFFHAPYRDRVDTLGLPPFFTPTWSVNLLPNTGTVYVEVKNQNPTAPVTVQVEALTRGGPLPWSCDVPRVFDADTPGALLYLGQVDCYTYTGSGADLTLEYEGPLDVRFKVVPNDPETPETLLQSGETYVGLEAGDLVMVYTYRNRQIGVEAGFCGPLLGCTDGLTTGEYWLRLD